MRTQLGIVAVTFALLLAACEEGPVSERAEAEPERHAIEGTWDLVEQAVTLEGYDDEGQPQSMDVTDQFLEETRSRTEEQVITLDDGTYRRRMKRNADSQRVYSTAQYYIDDEYQRLLVLSAPSYVDRATIYRYEMEGMDRLTLNLQIQTNGESGGADVPFTVTEA